MKEIHFYTNLTNEEQTSEWDLDTMSVDLFTSNETIENPDEEMVKTTQICLLRNAWDYIDKGYKIFIHNGNKVHFSQPTFSNSEHTTITILKKEENINKQCYTTLYDIDEDTIKVKYGKIVKGDYVETYDENKKIIRTLTT